MDSLHLLVPLFLLAALLYSSAGLGGGSAYIALLVLFSFPSESIPKTALVCNLIVAGGGFYLFMKEGYFSPRKVVPFLVTAIPSAFLGGIITIEKAPFQLILGTALLLSALRLFFSDKTFEGRREISWGRTWAVGLPAGILMGGMAGLVGIGGGVFLVPALLLMGWSHAREAAAAGSFFIFVNSCVGLLAQSLKGGLMIDIPALMPLIAAVFLGGQIGSRLGSRGMPKLGLQRISAVLILFASLRALWGFIYAQAQANF